MSNNDPSLLPCTLKIAAGEPDFDIQGTPGQVTLKVTGTTGTITFVSASYAEVPITPLPATEITFPVVEGIKNLDVVYFFSDTATGAGTLNQVCSARNLLGFVDASDPGVRYRIRGQE